MKTSILCIAACAGLLAAPVLSASECPPADATPGPYPTEVVADYVLGCMLSNGVSPDTLRKCSCSLDFVAAEIPYPEYEKVQTLLQLQQIRGGGRAAIYKGSNWAKNAIAHLREVQAESTLRCF